MRDCWVIWVTFFGGCHFLPGRLDRLVTSDILHSGYAVTTIVYLYVFVLLLLFLYYYH